LTDEQQKKSDQLLADVPDFLPKLPFAVVKDSSYIPNKDSWKPGEAVPDAEKNKTKTRRDFPRNTKEEKQEKETSQEKE
jgi:Ni/Co efflux regulator RcnB